MNLDYENQPLEALLLLFTITAKAKKKLNVNDDESDD